MYRLQCMNYMLHPSPVRLKNRSQTCSTQMELHVNPWPSCEDTPPIHVHRAYHCVLHGKTTERMSELWAILILIHGAKHTVHYIHCTSLSHLPLNIAPLSTQISLAATEPNFITVSRESVLSEEGNSVRRSFFFFHYAHSFLY